MTDIAEHYVRTLRAWRTRYLSQLEAVRTQGFDDRFIRMWEYYLALSEAGFATGISQDHQIVLEAARARVTDGSTVQLFPIRLGRRSRLVLLLFGVRPHNAYVDLGDELVARFGSSASAPPSGTWPRGGSKGPGGGSPRSACGGASATTT